MLPLHPWKQAKKYLNIPMWSVLVSYVYCFVLTLSGCYIRFSPLLSFVFMYSSDGGTVVKRVKDYIWQYVSTKSLLFSESEMTMNVVAAAFGMYCRTGRAKGKTDTVITCKGV